MSQEPIPTWIEASKNRWNVPLLDLEQSCQRMIATSSDRQAAENAISYGSEDGSSFIDEAPIVESEIDAEIVFPVYPILAPGVICIPPDMDHRWAIFFRHDRFIFVRSWQRRVFATATAVQQNGQLRITGIHGDFCEDCSPDLTRAIVKFLLTTYGVRKIIPAPLPSSLSDNPQGAGMWARTVYGKAAHVGTFDPDLAIAPESPLRSLSLLHIAAARSDPAAMTTEVEAGVPVDILSWDGSAPLHWSLASGSVQATEHLIKLGADPNVRTAEGTTPLMSSVESGHKEHFDFLVSYGADVNARDNRGFTALHRAAEMGRTEMVAALLNNGSDPAVEAEGHTPLSLAEMREEKEIAEILRGYI